MPVWRPVKLRASYWGPRFWTKAYKASTKKDLSSAVPTAPTLSKSTSICSPNWTRLTSLRLLVALFDRHIDSRRLRLPLDGQPSRGKY